jgi:transposase-like protein
MAVHLLTTDGVSTNILKDRLNITQKSAWYLTQRIIEAMKNHKIVLTGVVQVDETYFGPKARGRSSARYSKKYAVIGAAEAKPGGKVVLEVVKQPDATVAMSFIRRNIAPGSIIHTDESRIYGALKYEYQHATVNHSQHQYVDGGVTSNLIENNWMHAKRVVKGCRIWVSGKHLSSYMQGEHQFKRNMRNNTADERFTQWFSQAWGVRLTYKQLIAKRAVEPLALRGKARRQSMLPVQMQLL